MQAYHSKIRASTIIGPTKPTLATTASPTPSAQRRLSLLPRPLRQRSNNNNNNNSNNNNNKLPNQQYRPRTVFPLPARHHRSQQWLTHFINSNHPPLHTFPPILCPLLRYQRSASHFRLTATTNQQVQEEEEGEDPISFWACIQSKLCGCAWASHSVSSCYF